MASVLPDRKNIQIEEVRYKSGISEATGFKIAGAVNFINERQYDTKRFDINGAYSIPIVAPGLKTAVDGGQFVLFDCEIVGIGMFNIVAGSSGITELDIRRYTASNTPVGGQSIFFTTPKIPSSSGDYAYLHYRNVDNTILEQAPGSTLPVLATTQLNGGDFLVVDIVQSQVDAQNCGIVIFTRPR